MRRPLGPPQRPRALQSCACYLMPPSPSSTHGRIYAYIFVSNSRENRMKLLSALVGLAIFSGIATAQTFKCNLQDYKSVDGVKAEIGGNSVQLTWQGEAGQQLRAQFTLRDGQPAVQELAARKSSGQWIVLGKDLTPQFEVTTGRRRISSTEMDILKQQHKDTPDQIEQYKWTVFWDAPLAVPGRTHLAGPARTADEIARAAVSYKSDTCKVKTDGDRVSVTFNGLTLGLFSGDLQFTVYKGSNLLRQEALAKT